MRVFAAGPRLAWIRQIYGAAALASAKLNLAVKAPDAYLSEDQAAKAAAAAAAAAAPRGAGRAERDDDRRGAVVGSVPADVDCSCGSSEGEDATSSGSERDITPAAISVPGIRGVHGARAGRCARGGAEMTTSGLQDHQIDMVCAG